MNRKTNPINESKNPQTISKQASARAIVSPFPNIIKTAHAIPIRLGQVDEFPRLIGHDRDIRRRIENKLIIQEDQVIR